MNFFSLQHAQVKPQFPVRNARIYTSHSLQHISDAGSCIPETRPGQVGFGIWLYELYAPYRANTNILMLQQVLALELL